MYVFSPRLRVVSIFVLTYFVAGIVLAVLLNNQEFMLYEAQMAIIMGLLVWMDKRITFSPLVFWCLAIWGFLHLAGGLIPIPVELADSGEDDMAPVLYTLRAFPWLPRYDQIIHAFGFGTSAMACYEALQAHLQRKLPINIQIGTAVFLMALGLGCINEIIEFAVVAAIPQTNVGGYFNTGWDLVSNATGALIAILYMKFRA